MNRLAVGISVVAAALIGGCAHDVAGPLGPRDFSGSWGLAESFPGISYNFTLSVADTSVTGNGTFSIEAGASGTLSVTGSARDSSAQLTMHTSIGQVQHFNAVLVTADTMRGAFWSEGTPIQDPIVQTYVRVRR